MQPDCASEDTSKEQSPLSQALSRLDEEVGVLEQSMDSLVKKLDPITAPSPPEESVKMEEAPVGNSQICLSFTGIIHRISQTRRRVCALLRDVEA